VVELTTLEVSDGSTFTVGRVFCIGRNYAKHAREMGADERQPPFYFTKSTYSVTQGGVVRYPSGTSDLHHEVELVLGMGSHVYGDPWDAVSIVAIGLDLTKRDVQAAAKAARRPWAQAKDFDGAAPVGAVQPKGPLLQDGRVALWVNGELRQDGDLSEMIWPIRELLLAIGESQTLRPGDLIFTGTPAGVGPLSPGDQLVAEIEGVGRTEFQVEGA